MPDDPDGPEAWRRSLKVRVAFTLLAKLLALTLLWLLFFRTGAR